MTWRVTAVTSLFRAGHVACVNLHISPPYTVYSFTLVLFLFSCSLRCSLYRVCTFLLRTLSSCLSLSYFMSINLSRLHTPQFVQSVQYTVYRPHFLPEVREIIFYTVQALKVLALLPSRVGIHTSYASGRAWRPSPFKLRLLCRASRVSLSTR